MLQRMVYKPLKERCNMSKKIKESLKKMLIGWPWVLICLIFISRMMCNKSRILCMLQVFVMVDCVAAAISWNRNIVDGGEKPMTKLHAYQRSRIVPWRTVNDHNRLIRISYIICDSMQLTGK